jgi:hypothetical protein
MNGTLTENRLAAALGRDREVLWNGAPVQGFRLP